MVLEQLLRSGRQLVLGAALALSSAYGLGCGGDASGCVKDTDCREPRLCIENVCTGPDGSTGDDDDDSWHPSGSGCGDSPLYGKNVMEVRTCGVASQEPFKEDCTGTMLDIDGTHPSLAQIPVSYSGTTLTVLSNVEEYEQFNHFNSRFGVNQLTLRRNITESQIGTMEQCRGSEYNYVQSKEQLLCFLSEDPSLYAAFVNGVACPLLGVYRVSSHTALSEEEYEDREHGPTSWYANCDPYN